MAARHFADDILKYIFLNENVRFSIEFSLNIVLCSPIYNQWVSIGLDSGLAPKRWQAIIWTNYGLFYWRIYASLGLNE